MFRTTPVTLFLIESCTPGMTAPEVSMTVPESVAPVTWACALAGEKKVRAKTKKAARAERKRSEKPVKNIEASGRWDRIAPRCRHAVATEKRGTRASHSCADFWRYGTRLLFCEH